VVFPGIKSGNRFAYLGMLNETPAATAVLKIADKAKFCHLYIKPEFQDISLGDLFFAMMALDVKRKAMEIHFTLPESLWHKKIDFFKSFGFSDVHKSQIQYRLFEEELKCSANFETVWNKTLEKIPKIIQKLSSHERSIFNGLIISINPSYSEKILSGEKTVEIRKKFNSKWNGITVTLYSTRDTKAIVGTARIKNIIQHHPKFIWEKFGDKIGCSEKEFIEYCGNDLSVYAIFLTDIEPFDHPIYLTQLDSFMNYSLAPPQSYSIIGKSENWTKALSVAEIIQGKFKISPQVYG